MNFLYRVNITMHRPIMRNFWLKSVSLISSYVWEGKTSAFAFLTFEFAKWKIYHGVINHFSGSYASNFPSPTSEIGKMCTKYKQNILGQNDSRSLIECVSTFATRYRSRCLSINLHTSLSLSNKPDKPILTTLEILGYILQSNKYVYNFGKVTLKCPETLKYIENGSGNKLQVTCTIVMSV